MLNKKDRRLFVLDTGIRLSTMTSEVAHSISNTRVNFTNPVKTVSGSTLQIYRDSFDLQFANLSLDRQGNILEFDPSAIDQNAGMEVAGMLGFDILHSLVMHIDYRDGLVKFDSPASGPARTILAFSNNAAPAPSSSEGSNSGCTQYANQNADLPINSTIQAGVIGWLDSGHLKPGQSITVKVLGDWIAPSCNLTDGATLYGHVLAATASKSSATSELALSLTMATALVTLSRSFRSGSSALLEAIHSTRESITPCRRKSQAERGQSRTPLPPWVMPQTPI